MKKKISAAVLAAAMILSTSVVLAQSQAKEILVYESGAKIYADAKLVALDNAPFVYNGTTYLPIRSVSDALGEEVSYNATDKAIYIGIQPGVPQYMTEVVKPVDQLYGEVYKLDFKQKLTMLGRKYSTGIAIDKNGYMEFKLDGRFTTVKADLGIRGGGVTDSASISVSVYKDNKDYKTFVLSGSDSDPKKIEIPVTGTNILRVQVDDWDYGSASVGLGDPMIRW